MALIALSLACLHGGSMKFIWCNLKMSYHTVYHSRENPAVVCHLFLSPFISEPRTAFTRLSKFCTWQLKCTENRFILLPNPIFSLDISPIQNLKEALHMPRRMYSIIIHLQHPLPLYTNTSLLWSFTFLSCRKAGLRQCCGPGSSSGSGSVGSIWFWASRIRIRIF